MKEKEPAIAPNSETFSPFFNAGIRTLLFSADVLKKCALLALHVIAEEGRDGHGCHVPGLEDEWKMGCPKSHYKQGSSGLHTHASLASCPVHACALFFVC